MPKLVNRAYMSTATTGTGTITLGVADPRQQTFASAGVLNGDIVRYAIEDGTAWEIGVGMYSSVGPSLTRTATESSIGGGEINLSGNASVYVTVAAGDLQNAADMDQGVATTDSPSFAGLSVDTNTLYVDAANNRVGVGTTSPPYAFSVAGDIAASGRFYTYGTTTGPAAMKLGNGRTGDGYAYVDLIGDTTYTGYGLRLIRNNTGANAQSDIQHRGTGALSIQSLDAAPVTIVTSSAERVRVTSAGNVGIGTSIPFQRLHIKASGSTFVGFGQENTNGGVDEKVVDWLNNGASYSLRMVSDAYSAANVAYNVARSGTTPTTHSWLTAASGTPVERMRITSSGNVGINEAIPDYRLDVNGTIGFSPGSSVTPVDNGDVVFELTNNTTLTVKARGSDGVVRSGTITLT